MGEVAIHERLLSSLKEAATRRPQNTSNIFSDNDPFKFLCISEINHDKISESFPQKKYMGNASEVKSREVKNCSYM